jgi:predicted TIM-barrel fold metal-dependent hydrolase
MTQPVIDADGHVFEKQPEIRRYLEPPYDQRTGGLLPGGLPWDVDLFASLASRPMRKGNAKRQTEIWLRLMDKESVETAVLFPTGTAGVVRIPEPGYAPAVARATNNHLANDYGSRSPRLRPVGVLPPQEPQAAVEEMRRAVTDLGLLSFELPATGLPMPLGDRFYDPIYVEAERLGVPLCIHGSRDPETVGGQGLKTFSEIDCYAFVASGLLQFTSVPINAVPLCFPKLKLAFLEFGATWPPFYLDRMDEPWELRGSAETPWLTMRPSKAFSDCPIYVSIEAKETLLAPCLDLLGDDKFLFASDFPHWDAEFPKNLRRLRREKVLAEETKAKLLHDNAKTLFGL